MTERLGPGVAAELRHELRTPVNHIIGYAEMLREDAADDGEDAIALDRILAGARDVLRRINDALPPSGVATHADLDGLIASLPAPQGELLDAIASLQRPDRPAEFLADVRRIEQAARRLTNVPMPGDEPPAAPADDSQPQSQPSPDNVDADAVGGRVLVVDDVEENRAVLSRRLAREGFAVDSVATGEEALRRIARGGYDLVLLDVLMPGMDGFAVLDRIKGSPDTRAIPVIMISALDDLASVVRCIEHGAEDYLTKPFDPVLLRARVGASLEKKRWRDREMDYLRQVGRVIEAAGDMEHGTYVAGTLAGVMGRDDELGRLARVFDAMAAGVRAREARLREQLTELRADVSLATTEFSTQQAESEQSGDDLLATGSLFAGRYEILGIVGRGGMGVVYRARDRELDEDVAVKTLRNGLANVDDVAVERFRSEIRLARRISHRNVVRTHDLGEANGTSFVTMEIVHGLTLRELLATRGRLGPASTLAIARQFTDALAVAHAAGVIHRDIKPENALLDSAGVLKVMDFGIARLSETSATHLTQAGMVLGTPAYMAPEQLMGEEVDPRADLYALGAVLYECLTGRTPFQGANPMALIARVLTTTPDAPHVHHADVPPALSALVMRLLARDPSERPQSAAALNELFAELA